MEKNFVLIGHVDHGKSTCAGRLLVDTKTVDEGVINKAKADAELNGMKSWWLAYILDINDEERRKGKTHDYTIVPLNVSDDETKLNLVDVPGHRKFIQNMIKGASYANVAVLVVSAKKGEFESGMKGQTFEHLILARSMGISNLIVAINKMDHKSVNWSLEIFEKVKLNISKKLKCLKFSNVDYIPISAFNGDNVVIPKESSQETLLSLLTNIDVSLLKIHKKIYSKVSKITAECIFLGNRNIIAPGFQCTLHSQETMTECELIEIDKNPPFITIRDKKPIKIVIETVETVSVYDYILLRDGDDTICMGKVINCE